MNTKGPESEGKRQQSDSDVSMRRLGYLAAIGCLIVLIDAAGTKQSFLGTLSVGLMTAGAAMLVGGLLGFLFGVPYTREGEYSTGNKITQDSQSNQQGRSALSSVPTSYRPNTSLEQISDWLTKILVGVGLVQIKSIPGKLRDLAGYIAQGIGGASQAGAFVLTVLVYFSVCGFIFGFLWARIYLRRWFKEADQDDVKRLDDKLNLLEARQLADARALALISQQVNRGPDDPASPEEEIARAIREASTPIKIQVFDLALKESVNFDAPDYDLRNQAVICIFKGLISSDPGGRFHRNHAELSFALSRRRPPDLAEAEKNISIAIERRDRLGHEGWKYYELRRARCRIQQDLSYLNGKPSDSATRMLIISDLRLVFRETEKWKRWINEDGQEAVRKWITLNAILDESLRQV